MAQLRTQLQRFILGAAPLTLLLLSSSFSYAEAEKINIEDIKLYPDTPIKSISKEELKKDDRFIYLIDKKGDEHFFTKEYWGRNKGNIIKEMKEKGLL